MAMPSLSPGSSAGALVSQVRCGLHLLALCLALCGLSACACVDVKQEVADRSFRVAPKHILTVGGLDSQFSRVAADEFPDAIRSALARCAVRSDVYRTGQLQLNRDEMIQSLEARYQPDTLLDITQRVQVNNGGDISSGTYLLILRDVGSKRDIWSAEMQLYASGGGYSAFADRSGAAKLFADRIVERLAAADILTGCTPGTAASVKA